MHQPDMLDGFYAVPKESFLKRYGGRIIGGIACSAVVAMFMKESNEKTGLSLSPGILVAMAVALIFTLWIGFYPDPFIKLAQQAVLLG